MNPNEHVTSIRSKLIDVGWLISSAALIVGSLGLSILTKHADIFQRTGNIVALVGIVAEYGLRARRPQSGSDGTGISIGALNAAVQLNRWEAGVVQLAHVSVVIGVCIASFGDFLVRCLKDG